ncbi:MAG: PKD domain-containing protein, partial [Acidimicrobiaceae bacterium]
GAFRANDRVLETTSGATLVVTYVDPDFAFDRSEHRARTRIRQTAAVLESVDADGVPMTRFLVGVEPVFAQVTDTDQNRNPSARESVPVTFSSQLGDLESVQALETAADTGVFRMQSGMRTLIASNPARANGVLEVIGVGVQEAITIRYVDREDASDAPTVNPLVVFQEPSAVSFLDRDGNGTTEYVRGIDGVVVRVRDRDSNRSAGVAETVTATVEDLITHDVEVLNLLETGVNTGLFSNSGRPLQSVLVFPPSPVLGDTVLQAGAVAHLVRAVYRDAKDPSDTSNGTANLRPQDAADSDGDGMPDSWESSNGLNLSDPRDAALDNDGDGRTNLQEFRDGTDPNNPNDNRPIARPGQPRTVHPGRVTLDGTGSSSPGGLPLTYRWRQVTGSPVTLSGSDTAKPSFTALPAGLYEFELVVNNGRVDSFANRVAITVQDVAPVAEAGPVFTIDVGQSFSFHGEASRDPNSSRLIYSWLPLAGSLPTPANATGPTPIFAPSQARYYPIQLTVTDPAGNSSVSRTGLLVNGGASDHLPSADPGPDRVARAGSPVTLDGSASGDSDGNTLAYRWNFVSGPEVVTLTRSGALAIFTPLRDGFYRFELIVNDSATSDPSRDSAPVGVGVLVNGTNNVPTANPGADQIVSTGTKVVLDGRSSADPDHTILSYRWRQVGGASVELSSTTSAAPSFIPVLSGIHRFELVVSDGLADSKPTIVRVRVDSPSNHVPIANAGPDATGTVGTVVSLTGVSSFDEDASPLTYMWTQTQGPSVTLSNQSGPAPAFRPLAAGLYAFELTVGDGVNLSSADRVEFSVSSATNRPPVANAGNDQTVFLGATALTVRLNGSSSYDPDGSTGVAYLWTQTSGTTVSLAPDAGSATPTFTAPGIGNLEFSLTVRDRTGLRSSADKVVVTVVDGTE